MPFFAPDTTPEKMQWGADMMLRCQLDVLLDLARQTASLVPGSHLTVYEGASHGVFITHAERVNDEVLSFMRSVAGP